MRSLRRFLLCLLVVVVFDVAHAFGFLPDLKLDSVRIASQKEVDEYERLQPVDTHDRIYLIVTLASKIDLAEYRKKIINLTGEVYFCDHVEQKSLIGDPYLFVNKYPLYMHASKIKSSEFGKIGTALPEDVQAADFRDGLYHYELILNAELSRDVELLGAPGNGDQQFYLKYDLVKEPHDICIQVRSASWRIRKSKTIVIPRHQIKDLFQAAGMH